MLNLAAIKDTLALPNSDWQDISLPLTDEMRLCRIYECRIDILVTIYSTGKWEVSVHGQNITCDHCPLLKKVPCKVTDKTASSLVECVHKATFCSGNNDEAYVKMVAERKGRKVISPDGSVAAYIDETREVNWN